MYAVRMYWWSLTACSYIAVVLLLLFSISLQGFKHHVQNDHSKWNYIYFALYLDSLHTNDHNALEKYVHDNVCVTNSMYIIACTRVIGHIRFIIVKLEGKIFIPLIGQVHLL